MNILAVSMPLLFGLLAVAVLLAGWWWVQKRGRVSSRPAEAMDTVLAWSPQPTRLLSAAERDAYQLLRETLPEYTVLAQVPVARFIKVPTRNSYAEWLRRVGRLSVDFAICDAQLQVIAVVELQGPPAKNAERAQRRRDRVERVLTAARIPVHIWREDALPSPSAVRQAIAPRAAEAAAPAKAAAPQPIAAAPAEDEGVVVREAPPSTWFDDIETEPAPLEVPRRSGEPTPR